MATLIDSARARDEEAGAPRRVAETLRPAAVALAVDEIQSLDGLEGLARDWDALLDRSRDRHLSVTRPWLRAWWQCFGTGARLRLLAVRDGSRLVGIAPLLSRREVESGIPCRVVRFLSNRFVPWCDFVTDPDVPRAAVLGAVFDHLGRAPERPDLVWLRNIPRDSGTIDALGSALAKSALAHSVVTPRRSPVVPIAGTWEDYLGSLSGRFRKTVSRALRTFAGAGISLETVREGTRSAEIIEAGLRLEAAGWKGENGSAILGNAAVAAFHRSLAARPGARQYVLWQDGAMIAWDLCVHDDGACYALKTAYDESRAKMAPGVLIQLLELRELFASRSVRVYDQLPPETGPKVRWGKDYVQQVSARVYGRTPVGATLWLLDAWVRGSLRRVGWLRRAKGKFFPNERTASESRRRPTW
jgi:hypothetical protein